MDHFHKLHNQVLWYLTSAFLLLASFTIGALLFGLRTFGSLTQAVLFAGVVGIVFSVILGSFSARYVLSPLRFVWDAILHVLPDHTGVAAPNIEKIKLGRELLTSLTLEVYQLASQQDSKSLEEHRLQVVQAANVVSHIPLPLFVFNKDVVVTNASNKALDYCKLDSSQLFGKPLFDNVDLEFTSENTLEAWITECQKNKVTDIQSWEHVRVRLGENEFRQCDIAAYYNRDNPSGTEFIVTFYDRSRQYGQDDTDLAFVALAVHELRSPLTMLRGYIEVFEDELSDKLDPEMVGFMHKMSFSAQRLVTFTNNILNVARIEENQLSLQLTEANWAELLKQICEEAQARAQVHGIALECEVAQGLPTVAVDHVSITEVLNNLVDNAVKYSGDSKRVIVHSEMSKDGTVQTSIQDFGAGIPKSVMPKLFEKFYRNHRTKAQVGGTGLGLYLSKALVTAHGGQIWAESKEGEGSVFGFTLIPYADLSDELKSGKGEIVRTAHGWIKNHSLYRR